MPLRIHFTSDDLARVTVVPRPDLLWELALSLTVLQTPQAPSAFRAWRSRAAATLATPDARRQARLLTTLVPPQGAFPDFITPPCVPRRGLGLAESVETLRDTPARMLRSDLPVVFRDRRPPTWVRELAGGEPRRLRAVVDAMRAYGEAVVLPHLRAIEAAVHADQALRGRDLLHGGVHQMLAGLPPPLRWTPPVLETEYPHDRDLHLCGRGLMLVPAYFCWGTPITLIDPELPPVLVYPAAVPGAADGTQGRLAELLGATRAQVLRTLRVPQTTSELAERVGVSVASASRHAAVLRDAGLVTSTRHANAVVHAVTGLGGRLLECEARANAGTPEQESGECEVVALRIRRTTAGR